MSQSVRWRWRPRSTVDRRQATAAAVAGQELTDLLAGGDRSPQDQKLELRETGRGVCCTGLTEHLVSTVAEIQELMRRAQERRSVRETRANACSSRSHCLFTFKVCCRQAVADGEVETVGKLHLVDLAGSECARKADERAFASGSDIATAKGERERRPGCGRRATGDGERHSLLNALGKNSL
ncbi:unnamed protein product [Prorocentrum cordatum]|uniref:Kinesin motor domain-containing protein n=1 Tax=Prorocentrum cordatum TaxID=2364126 RepID=A0ABN9T9G7_9DINO|nr:unnamed protein product [Polarella glacialis]